jgi:hypothetical protein
MRVARCASREQAPSATAHSTSGAERERERIVRADVGCIGPGDASEPLATGVPVRSGPGGVEPLRVL